MSDRTHTAAESAQRIRAHLLSWQDVKEVYGPQSGQPGQVFLRAIFDDGRSFAIELTEDSE